MVPGVELRGARGGLAPLKHVVAPAKHLVQIVTVQVGL